MFIASILFYFAYFCCYIKGIFSYKNIFVYKIPVYIMVYEIWTVIAGYYHIDTGINGMFSVMMMIYVVYYFINNSHKIRKFNHFILFLIVVFLSYLFFRVDFIYDIESMITRYLSYFNLFAFMIISFCETTNRVDVILLVKNLLIMLCLYALATIIFSIFRIGESMYGINIVYGLAHMQPNSVAVITAGLLCIFTIMRKRYLHVNRKYFYLFILIVLFLCITFRRTYPMLMITVAIPFFVFQFKFKYILIMSLCIVFGVAFYSFVGIKRDRFMEMDTNKEGRFVEYKLVNELLKKSNFEYYFGNGMMFVTRGKYKMDNRENRPLHTGHAEMLLGAGIVGLFLFWLPFTLYFFSFLKHGFLNKRKNYLSLLISFPIIYIVLSFSGGIRAPSSIMIMIFYTVINKYLIYVRKPNYRIISSS